MARAADPALTRGLAEITAERWLREHGTSDPGLFVDFCAEAMRVAVERQASDRQLVEVTEEDVASMVEILAGDATYRTAASALTARLAARQVAPEGA